MRDHLDLNISWHFGTHQILTFLTFSLDLIIVIELYTITSIVYTSK